MAKRVEVTVTATVYHPVTEQTDSTPNQLADGTAIDSGLPPTWPPVSIPVVPPYRILALSRDLLSRWGGPFKYGDVVEVRGAGPLNGQWTVRDTMNKRFTKRCDFLVAPYFKSKYEGVKVRLVSR